MKQELTVTIERVDDLPVLLTTMKQMGLPELVDEHFKPHGNWQGLSPGEVMSGWLAYILSEGDHRLNQVEAWAQERQHVLRPFLNDGLQGGDFQDDRLAIGLDLLSDDKNWAEFEAALNQRTLRVYALEKRCVRLDTTSASGYWTVSENGLFQFGHSKEHRPDLPQAKVMLATLDPLGMPLVTQVVSGEKADDPLYIPAIDEVRKGVEERKLLYVGDSKMMSLATRAHLVAGDDYYLGPLALTQAPQATIDAYLAPVWTEEQPLTGVYREQASGETAQIAEGFEVEEQLTARISGQAITWTERRLVIRSLQHAAAAKRALHHRLAQAEEAILALNQPKQGRTLLTTVEEMQAAGETILKRKDVAGLLTLTCTETVTERQVRKYGDRPPTIRTTRTVQVAVERNTSAIQTAENRLGWRVYGTNQPAVDLTLEEAVLAYRNEYLIERNFGRLKGRSLSLTPMYLADDNRATGLIRLLTLGLRLLSVVEGVVRQRLAESKAKLAGLYAGNPKRTTSRPTAESLLRAFKGIALSFVTISGRTYPHLTPLSDLQHNILGLLDYPTTIYTQLAANSPEPP